MLPSPHYFLPGYLQKHLNSYSTFGLFLLSVASILPWEILSVNRKRITHYCITSLLKIPLFSGTYSLVELQVPSGQSIALSVVSSDLPFDCICPSVCLLIWIPSRSQKNDKFASSLAPLDLVSNLSWSPFHLCCVAIIAKMSVTLKSPNDLRSRLCLFIHYVPNAVPGTLLSFNKRLWND